IAAARIGEGMVRQRDHVLEEQARGHEWLNRPKVPAVAFAVEVFEVEPAIAYVDGLDLHFRFGKGAWREWPGADNRFTGKLDALDGSALAGLLPHALLQAGF